MKKNALFFSVWFMILIIGDISYALTTEQVLQLKKAGVSEETIQIMIRQEMERKETGPFESMGVREVTDKSGNIIQTYSTGSSCAGKTGCSEDENVEKAWKMLQNIIIDRRK